MAERAIVTGGAGFIGSHVVDRLVEAGTEVVVVDDLSTGRRENLRGALERGARLQESDVRDVGAMRRLVADARPDAVLHLAARASVTASVEEPEEDAGVNVGGTLAMLEAARRAGVARVVYVSTGGALYGDADIVPTSEEAPIAPLSPYGTSKWGGELYADLYARLHGMSTVTLRLANVYGPRQDPHGEAGVVAIFCERLRAAAAPTVYGDGHQTRDYVYVGDVAEAILVAAAAGARGSFNVGTGQEATVLDLVAALRELGGGEGFEPEHAPPRPGEARRSCLDPRRAEQALGWRATTTLRDGLRATLESFGPR
jgi:UDP-glucose 4-epimerase